MPAARYEHAAGRATERHIAHVRRRARWITPEEEDAERGRLRKILDEARSLDEETFALRKAELAGRIKEPWKNGPGKMGASAGERKVVRFLLDERIIPLLERRQKIAGSF